MTPWEIAGPPAEGLEAAAINRRAGVRHPVREVPDAIPLREDCAPGSYQELGASIRRSARARMSSAIFNESSSRSRGGGQLPKSGSPGRK